MKSFEEMIWASAFASAIVEDFNKCYREEIEYEATGASVGEGSTADRASKYTSGTWALLAANLAVSKYRGVMNADPTD